MPEGQDSTSCGTTVATALKRIDAIYTCRSFVTAVFLLSTSGSPDLSLARRFHFFRYNLDGTEAYSQTLDQLFRHKDKYSGVHP